MKDTKKLVSDYLKAADGCPVKQIYTDVWPDETSPGVICRYDPSSAKDRQYNDGSRRCVQNLAYYARSPGGTWCRDVLQWIIDTIDTEHVVRDSDGAEIDCEAVTLPQFVSMDDKKNTVYTIAVQCEYTETAKGEMNG